MKKLKFLYHGSPKKIYGKYLIPNIPKDLSAVDNGFVKPAVYATPYRNDAIARALVNCNGVYASSLFLGRKRPAVIYQGWPEQEIVYLHVLSAEFFEEINSHESVSYIQVKPMITERLEVKSLSHLVRKATANEIKTFSQRYFRIMGEELTI
jgi:hypothetical protein